MPLINLIIILAVFGVMLWAINTYLPMDPKIKQVLNLVAIIGVCFWLLAALGVVGNLNAIRIGG